MSAPRTAVKALGGFVVLCIVGGTIQSVFAQPVEYREKIVYVQSPTPAPQVITERVEVPVPVVTQVPGPRRTIIQRAPLPESCASLVGMLDDFGDRSAVVSEDVGELQSIAEDLATETVGKDTNEYNKIIERLRALNGRIGTNQIELLEANRGFENRYKLCNEELKR